mmetsp:Transcript_3495/g.7553  ORF Transcript_3495/g.7553 Transcript_3495/m.7553 type:complete len:358 (+) Transcript_3495:54-1127(+)
MDKRRLVGKARIPSLCAFSAFFTVACVPGAAIALTQTIYIPAVCAFVAPLDAAEWSTAIMGLASAANLLAPVFGVIADALDDTFPAMLAAIAISIIGFALSIASLFLRSIWLFALGAGIVMPVGGCGNTTLLFSIAGMFGSIAPERSGSITSMLIFAITLIPLSSALLNSALPVRASDYSYFYVLLSANFLSLIAMSALRLRSSLWFQPLELADAPVATQPVNPKNTHDETTRPPNNVPNEESTGCCSAARPIVSDWSSTEYRPLISALAAGVHIARPDQPEPQNGIGFEPEPDQPETASMCVQFCDPKRQVCAYSGQWVLRSPCSYSLRRTLPAYHLTRCRPSPLRAWRLANSSLC